MRIRELQKHLKNSNIDFALFFDEFYLKYFCDTFAERICLAVPSSGDALLFVSGFEADRLSRESCVSVVGVDRDLLGNVRSRFSGRRVGVVKSGISFDVAGKLLDWGVELVGVDDFCRDLRLVKTADEVKRITKACAFTDLIFGDVCERFHLFRTERDVECFLKLRMSELGVVPSFSPIVASGVNAAVPHHVPGMSRLSGFTVLDFGVVFKNYCSDLSRTVFVGSPSDVDRRNYDNLLGVQEKCIDMLKPGVLFDDVDSFAKKGVGVSMIHRVGHSLGVEVHDVQPRPWMLCVGNVVTVEPGTYFKGKFGIRIEDDVLVSDKSPIVLSRSSKNLFIVR